MWTICKKIKGEKIRLYGGCMSDWKSRFSEKKWQMLSFFNYILISIFIFSII